MSPRLRQATGVEDWEQEQGVPGVAAWMGEPPVRDPEMVHLWGETH